MNLNEQHLDLSLLYASGLFNTQVPSCRWAKSSLFPFAFLGIADALRSKDL